jgi:hypothetical protein|tara:strand:- start:328 stop:915 length:588 start_codon:yes stop_codon:yes gene_type:complete
MPPGYSASAFHKKNKRTTKENNMTNGLLPNDYDIPSASNSLFFRLQKGENKFRILDTPLTGYVWFENTIDGLKPQRCRDSADIPTGTEKPKHFWFMPVAVDDEIKLLEITQKTVLNELAILDRSPVWGNLSKYEVIVTRSGEGLDTKYSVTPCPKSANKMEAQYVDFRKGYKPDNLFSGLSVVADKVTSNDGLPF